ncbi:unnamed protein product [Adineta steineri]|uniref:Apple domain-containing protein n=2 Tax=Adineta steineri TaxID=433720 RepID=A0A815T3N0_9BILA|nr:unnamed protein product [Adineta steineri]
MAYARVFLLLLFVYLAQTIEVDRRSFKMSVMNGWRFQCANTTCLPFNTVRVSNMRNCQMTCLAQIFCEAASFYTTTSNCNLFAYISNQIGSMSADTNTITMIVIAATRIPSG